MSDTHQPHDVSANAPDLRFRPFCGAFVPAMPGGGLECAHPATQDPGAHDGRLGRRHGADRDLRAARASLAVWLDRCDPSDRTVRHGQRAYPRGAATVVFFLRAYSDGLGARLAFLAALATALPHLPAASWHLALACGAGVVWCVAGCRAAVSTRSRSSVPSPWSAMRDSGVQANEATDFNPIPTGESS